MTNFLIKLLRALNSSERVWQITVALVLGFISGLTPVDAIHNIFILFIVLILNVNFGLYLIATGFFSALAYLFDPMFDMIGFYTLTSPTLESLFTSFYNNNFLILTHFNNSIVMGSLIVSLVLALPFYFLVNKIFAVYRVQIAEKLNSFVLTKYLYIFGSGDGDKKAPLFRWWGVGLFLSIMLLSYLFATLIFDALIKTIMEKSLQSALNTKVKIESVTTNFGDVEFKLHKLVVYDKKDNTKALVTVNEAKFNLAFEPLLRKKFYANHLELTGVEINKNAPTINEMAQENVSIDIKGADLGLDKSTFDFANLNIDDILANEKLTTIEEAKKIEDKIKSLKDKWNNIKNSGLNKEFIEEIKQDISSIKNGPNDAMAIASKIEKISKIEKKIKQAQKDIQDLKDTFTKEQKEIMASIETLKKAPFEDYEKLKSKYTLDFNGAYNLVDLLLKDDISGYKKYADLVYEKIKPYMNNVSKQDNVITRDDGRWVLYKETNQLPIAVIEKAKFDISFDDKKFDINVKDFSTDQTLYKHPTISNLISTSNDFKSLNFYLKSDRVAQIESFELSINDLIKKDINAQKISLKDNTIDIKANGNIKNLATINSTFDINFDKTSLAYKNPSKKFEQILDTTLKSFNDFKLTVKLTEDIQNPKIDITSNITDKLNNSVSKIFEQEQQKFMAKLQSKLQDKLGENLNIINSSNTRLLDVNSLLNNNSDQLNNLLKDLLSSKSNSNPINNILNNKGLKGLLPF